MCVCVCVCVCVCDFNWNCVGSRRISGAVWCSVFKHLELDRIMRCNKIKTFVYLMVPQPDMTSYIIQLYYYFVQSVMRDLTKKHVQRGQGVVTEGT